MLAAASAPQLPIPPEPPSPHWVLELKPFSFGWLRWRIPGENSGFSCQTQGMLEPGIPLGTGKAGPFTTPTHGNISWQSNQTQPNSLETWRDYLFGARQSHHLRGSLCTAVLLYFFCPCGGQTVQRLWELAGTRAVLVPAREPERSKVVTCI